MEMLAEISNLTVRYGQVTAVDGVSLTLGRGEIVAVLGPNGSGKTSMVECLEGLRRPAEGTVQVLGMDPHTQRQQVYQHLGVQLQSAEYPDKIKVGELCRLFSSFYSTPADWSLLAKQLGLEDKHNRYIQKLSGGERQRLSILLALLPKPQLLILDELTTGLDPEVRRSLWDSLKAIRDFGTGILLVSHYMDEVAVLADRLAFMLDGKMVYTGTPAGLWAYAKTVVPESQWRQDLSLEDLYLLLVPHTEKLTLEALT